MIFPCEGCLKYPICKHRIDIKCDEIYMYVDERNSFPIQMSKVKRIFHEGRFTFGHYLNKGTTRWFPDS